MLQLYFIRHGQSTNNVIMDDLGDDYLLARKSDPELTPLGVAQARLLAEALSRPTQDNGYDPQNRSGFGLTHLYCSLMVRAVHTGLAIAEKTKLPLFAWAELHETGGLYDTQIVNDEPIFTGQPGQGRAFFESNFPQLVIPADLPVSGWYNQEKEPHEHYPVRAQAIINRLLAEHGGTDHRVGIVMHAGIFARVISALFNIQAENYWVRMNNCAISRVDVHPEGRVTLSYLNKVDHLPDHLVS